MDIKEVKIRSMHRNAGSLKAIVSVTVGDFAIHDIKVIKTDSKGYFVAMPNRRENNGAFRDIVHPIGRDAREHLQTAILNMYFEHLQAVNGGIDD